MTDTVHIWESSTSITHTKQIRCTNCLRAVSRNYKSALISVITTAGFDLKSPCYKLYEYCCNLLKGVFENDSQFVYIAQLDTADDLYKKENWIKANPILEFDEGCTGESHSDCTHCP